MNNLKYLVKNENKVKYNEQEIKDICASAYKEDKKAINAAIKYLAKR